MENSVLKLRLLMALEKAKDSDIESSNALYELMKEEVKSKFKFYVEDSALGDHNIEAINNLKDVESFIKFVEWKENPELIDFLIMYRDYLEYVLVVLKDYANSL